ncbi:MAG: septum formation initiator family protein [Flavobacteriales bacterium]|nr:septum formation initiator family protein [Flavobacteriales bacterium]
MMKLKRFHIPKILRNKYIIATLTFLAWVCFINDVDLFYIIKTRNELSALRTELRGLYEATITTEKELSDLTHNRQSLEKFAREKYYMKKENEEVFVFREKAD